jgi:hypothetical protein
MAICVAARVRKCQPSPVANFMVYVFVFEQYLMLNNSTAAARLVHTIHNTQKATRGLFCIPLGRLATRNSHAAPGHQKRTPNEKEPLAAGRRLAESERVRERNIIFTRGKGRGSTLLCEMKPRRVRADEVIRWMQWCTCKNNDPRPTAKH